ncbi:hypothetical protein MMC28_004106 [Neofusicoccum parvum]|uniref:Uncharacterized protein n=1 Tax=Neofusicoccum parvum TaxID=310453 RepID=A0ACB5SHH0_9PEZI|nr:hypothetical protein MMC28_004106 [Neofusicoccum parvum]
MEVLVTNDAQLEKRLNIDDSCGKIRLRLAEVNVSLAQPTLPGQPRQLLEEPGLLNYLKNEHLTPDLDAMAPKLWLALHHQAARGRQIILSETPALHLVWHFQCIFIKPIPRYMLSHAFWQYAFHHSTDTKDLYGASAGFMRSYSYLIRYQSDFDKAISESLIPGKDSEGNAITFERFAKFIEPFARLKDERVSPRFQYGELRLTRLNIFTRFLLGKLTYFHINAQWASYLKRYLTPMITTFAIFSVVLNAVQVALAAQTMSESSENWQTFSDASWYFSVTTVITAAIGISIIASLVIFMFINEHLFARKVLLDKKKAKDGRRAEIEIDRLFHASNP